MDAKRVPFKQRNTTQNQQSEQMVRERKRAQNTVGEWQEKRERHIKKKQQKKNRKRRVLVCLERN